MFSFCRRLAPLCLGAYRCAWMWCLLFAHVQAHSGLGPNQGDFRFEADLTDMQVTISPRGGVGCPAGQHEDIRVGGCTTELLLHTQSSSQTCPCSCPQGYSGTCSGTRTGVTTIYGWLLPPWGVEFVSRVAGPEWGVCKVLTSNCNPVPGQQEAAGPAVGDSFKISTTALICGPTDSGYAAVNVHDSYKNQLIGHYRAMGISGRCPELSGYTYWLNEWRDGARLRAVETYPADDPGANWSAHLADGYTWYWDLHLRRAVDHSATVNDEAGNGGVLAANEHCQRSANARYGIGKVTASYVLQSGNLCRINAVH